MAWYHGKKESVNLDCMFRLVFNADGSLEILYYDPKGELQRHFVDKGDEQAVFKAIGRDAPLKP